MAIRCLKLAGIYLLIGMTLGIAMGVTERFALAPAHAHVNLLGWVTLAIAAAVFALWPPLAATRLAQAFFWLYNLALPPSMVALAMVLLGHPQWMPLLIVGQLAVYLSAILFVGNVLLNLRAAQGVPAAAHAERRTPVLSAVTAVE